MADLGYLLSAKAVRDRSQTLMALCQADQLTHFRCVPEQLGAAVDWVLETISQNLN